jgi:hypothetical protein
VAPARPAAAVVGTGPASADELLPWDGPELASLLGGAAASPSVERRLRRCEAALALSRSAPLRQALATRIPRVLVGEPLPPPESPHHAASWALRAAAPLVSPEPPASLPKLDPGRDAEREAERWLAQLPPGFLALHPGSGSPRKNWPADRFAELARRLSPEAPWLLVGGPADSGVLERLATAPGSVLARNLPLRELAAVLSHAGIYIGNDAGVSHLAAASGAPTLALFGPTHSTTWRPLGQRVLALEAPGGDLAALGVDVVEEAAGRLQRGGS